MKNTDILIVDDEIGIRDLLSDILQDEGYTVAVAEDAAVARRLREQTRPAMVLLDIWMPDCDGITLLKEWSANGLLDMPVVMMSGHASIDTAVEATKIGALDFLEKPIALQKLLSTVQKAMKYSEMQASHIFGLDDLGKSEALRELKSELSKAAETVGNLLLVGEPGSAFSIVAHSLKRNKQWVEIEPETKVEGLAIDLLRKAQNGIIYIGDIVRLDYRQQEAILNHILNKQASFNIKVISASSKPVQELFGNSDYSSIFLEKLTNIIVTIPPLKNVQADLPYLINRVLRHLIESKQVKETQISPQAITTLLQYNWPGNFEQLKSVLKSIILNIQSSLVSEEDVKKLLVHYDTRNDQSLNGVNFDMPLRELREELEKRYFEYHIRQENHNMSRVAQKVGLERTHLYRKLKQLGIQFSKKS